MYPNPNGGSISVNPTNGIALKTDFTISVIND